MRPFVERKLLVYLVNEWHSIKQQKVSQLVESAARFGLVRLDRQYSNPVEKLSTVDELLHPTAVDTTVKRRTRTP